jgi:hypothetical protein
MQSLRQGRKLISMPADSLPEFNFGPQAGDIQGRRPVEAQSKVELATPGMVPP